MKGYITKDQRIMTSRIMYEAATKRCSEAIAERDRAMERARVAEAQLAKLKSALQELLK